MTVTTTPRLTAAQISANFRTVHKRSGGICEGCGLEKTTTNRRRKRSEVTVENLLDLCLDCFHLAISPLGPSLGWRITTNHNPADVPVWRRVDQTWRRFDADGGFELLNPCDAVEFLRLIGAIKEGLTA